MKAWQYAILLALLAGLLGLILWLVPSTNYIVLGVVSGTVTIVGGLLTLLYWLWLIIKGLLALILVLAFSAFFGLVIKGFLMAWIDSLLVEGEELSTNMHWGIAILGGLLFGLLHSLAMQLFMGWDTWLRIMSMMAGWRGSYEVPSLLWAIYGLLTFGAFYMLTEYLIKPERRSRRSQE